MLGIPEPLEIEKKFLVRMPDLNRLAELYNLNCSHIIQTYIKGSKPDTEYRVRKRGQQGSYTYYLTEKRKISGLARVEVEKKISRSQYETHLRNAIPGWSPIEKTRFCFVANDLSYELDIYPFSDGFAILEVEVATEEDSTKVVVPEGIEMIADVTENARFKNSTLAKLPEMFNEYAKTFLS
jgi:Uncharacterized protein conserved in bacteria